MTRPELVTILMHMHDQTPKIRVGRIPFIGELVFIEDAVDEDDPLRGTTWKVTKVTHFPAVRDGSFVPDPIAEIDCIPCDDPE